MNRAPVAAETTREEYKLILKTHLSDCFGEDSSPKECLALKLGGCRILKTYNKETKTLLIAVHGQSLRESFLLAAKHHKLQHKAGRASQHALEKAMQSILEGKETGDE